VTAPTAAILPAPAEAQGKTLTDAQIATWAKQGGFTGEDVVTAVAVALAESGGRYAVVSGANFNGTRDYGLWQINSVHAHLFQQHPSWWTVSNGKMAKAVHASQGWNAWTVYKSQAYRLFLPRARAAAGAAPEGGVVSEDDPAANYNTSFSLAAPLGDIANVFRAGFQPLTAAGAWIGNADNWVRVAQVVLGAALVVAGITIVARPVVSQVAGPVAAVITKGKGAK
jgi:Lysozyme like domain